MDRVLILSLVLAIGLNHFQHPTINHGLSLRLPRVISLVLDLVPGLPIGPPAGLNEGLGLGLLVPVLCK